MPLARFKVACVLVLLFCVGRPAFAQTATSGNALAWDQAAPDLATAQGYTFKYYADGVTTAVTLAGVTCTGTASPFTCKAAWPAFAPGSHTLQLSASNVAGESAKSTAMAFTFVVQPAAPVNLRIQ